MTSAPERPSSSDADLTAWVDAATLGGFPAPARADRWRVLRAGVVNLWEFDTTEYWFANGWAQLTGRNETGKSSLMALTTLIPWLADTSSSNIDTLGRSGKRFRYYVEPTGGDGDRRSQEATTNRGWLWVEYGRLTDAGPRFFTTLLFAETRSAAADVRLTWCSVEGTARVRDTIDLAPQRMVAAPKDLSVPGLVIHPNATAYREHVASRLLGSTTDRLEAIGKMLKVTRTPKLGAQLEIGFVQKHLRSALPELSRAEVDALANGWEQLDQIRADLASTKAAAETLERFRRTAWLPWARAVVRQRADTAGSARTAFDGVTRRETEAADEVQRGQGVLDERTRASEVASLSADGARRAASELEASSGYRDAEARAGKLEDRRRALAGVRRQLVQDSTDLDAATRRQTAAHEQVGDDQRAHDAQQQEAEHLRELLLERVRPLLDVPGGDDLDLARTQQALDERVRTVDAAAQRVRGALSADAGATASEETAAAQRGRADLDARAADEAWAEAEAARETLAQTVLAWVAGLTPEVPDDAVDAWLAALPSSGADVGDASLDDAIRADWHDPAQAAWIAAKERAGQRLRHARDEAARIQSEIDALLAAPSADFPGPHGWHRRARPEGSAAGAPLWSLIDPRDGIPDDDLARVEAALAASSLLDAWVTPDGVFNGERDGHDLVVTPPAPAPAPGRTLADVLQVAECDPALHATVAGLLAGITLGDPDDQAASDSVASPLVIALDGRWRAAGVSGRAAPQHATPEWVGESARAHRRRRRVQELTDELDVWRAETATAAQARDEAAAGLHALASMMERRPRDADLRRRLQTAAGRTSVAEQSAAEADQAEAAAGRLRASADSLRAEVTRWCGEQRLPTDPDDLQRVRDAVSQARHAVDRLDDKLKLVAVTARTLQGATERHAAALAALDEMQARRRRTARDEAELTTTVAALEQAVDSNDREILDQLNRLRTQADDAARVHAVLEKELGTLREGLARARAQLENTAKEREIARDARDAAWSAFRVLIDRGLDIEIGLAAADPGFSTAERVRDQVAIARREVTPPRWPSTADEQDVYVRRLGGELGRVASEDTRIKLEADGRTLRINYDDHGLPVVEVLVDSSGAPLGPRAASARLGEIHDELSAAYTQRVQETLDELLGSTFLEHLRERVGATQALIKRINDVLAHHPVVTTSTSLRIVLEPASTSDAAMIEAVGGPSLANPEVAGQVRDRLRERVEEAKRMAESQGDEDWRGRLAQQLDYRDWFEVQLKKRVGQGGRWLPLTTQGFAEMSGGARAVILMLPLVATLAALYEDLDGSPRPLWLDEAFDGLDSSNREMVMDLFNSFDLDVLLAGPARLVNVASVPAAAIYQVVRAPAPMPGVDLTLELWAGGDLVEVPLPSVLPVGRAVASEEMLL